MEMEEYYQYKDRESEYHKTHERIRGGVEMGVAIGDFMNGADRKDVNELLTFMTNLEHRTIQQSYFGLVLKSIEAFAAMEERQIDPRNRCAVEKARKLKEFMDKEYISSGMPLI